MTMENKVENEGMPVVRLDRQLKYEGNILKIYQEVLLCTAANPCLPVDP